jgi:RNA polymerase-binding transcription factor DksA
MQNHAQNPLSKTDLMDYRLLLAARRAVIRGEVLEALQRSENEHYRKIAGEVTDAGDMSVADLLVDVNLSVVDHHIGELRDIEAAIGRIGDGSYGVCTDCGRNIIARRLIAYPTAKRCLHCQKRHERWKLRSHAAGARRN